MGLRKVFVSCVAVALTISVGISPFESTAGAATSNSEELLVGISRLDITPPVNPDYPPLNEYEHEKLYVRAIVFENNGTRGALIGADISGIDEPVWADASTRIAAELDTPLENIIISPTHIHSDRPAGPPPPSGTPRYGTDFIADVLLDAVKEAASEMEPALVGYSTGTADLNVNRDTINPETHRWTQAANLDAPSDKTVAVLSFVRPNGKPIAAYVNYAMHPVNGYLSGVVSGDFASATSRYVEQAFGDDMITVFTQGASGDQNPRWLRTGTNALASKSGVEINGYELVREDVEAPLRNNEVPHGDLDPEIAKQLADYMEALGIILGEEVIRVMTHTEEFDASPVIRGLQETLTFPGRKRLDNAREGVAGVYEDGDDVDVRIGVLGIGDIALATVNAEVYTKIGLRVKEESPMTKTMFVTIANGKAASGYIPDNESFGHQTFQVLGSRLQPGYAEDRIVDGIADLASEYMALSSAKALSSVNAKNAAKVLFDGEDLSSDSKVYKTNGVTMIPFRPIFTKLGMSVEWDNVEKSVTAQKDGLTLKLTMDSTTAYVNGEAVQLTEPPFLADGTLIVGIRFVSESAGAKVSWDQKTQTVTINSK
ncbi:neutral/alkaline non-lysosomal ceramidase N-terminal domain-containing protein [Paenibacillus sp. LHD-117]|uniref:neutral/alkaline non-lysosomal ceramidase N-terminal domain-containing protein n=1 Tax=Paenibacillus sp. LHD-117 TaxID=3071412 RepID=UPI0027E06DBC|nr:neutral/alkaline non-lysosomal ceramidase N-terminal domain-containing protein [Paenibacillus sp. LHD-117]MDQ6421774.1 neutral/alkaline non-lysosomal ceramidase N-terminal domain-containing protein [Paenibacillus sp. LHD-117]